MNKAKKAYDEIPYFSAAFSDCSPVRIEAVAKFLGLKVANLKDARVLELGSSYGVVDRGSYAAKMSVTF